MKELWLVIQLYRVVDVSAAAVSAAAVGFTGSCCALQPCNSFVCCLAEHMQGPLNLKANQMSWQCLSCL